MFLERFKLIISILIVVLLLSVSANVIAFNQDSDQSTSTGTNEENSRELEVNNDVVTTNLPIEKVSPSEVISAFPQLERSNYYPQLQLGSQNAEPFTLPVEEYSENTLFTPTEVLQIAEASTMNQEFKTYGSRARADAGDDQGSSTPLEDGGNWTGDKTETHIGGNPPQYNFDDVDWFRIWVREKGSMKADYVTINIENTAPPSSSNTRDLHCYMWEPLSIILNTSTTWPFNGPNLDKTLSTADDDVPQKFIDAEIIDPGNSATLNAAPPITSWFFIILIGISDMILITTLPPYQLQKSVEIIIIILRMQPNHNKNQ